MSAANNWEGEWNPDSEEEIEYGEPCLDPECPGTFDEAGICDTCGLDLDDLPGGEVVDIKPSISSDNQHPITCDDVLLFHEFITDDRPGIGGRGMCWGEKNFFRRLTNFAKK